MKSSSAGDPTRVQITTAGGSQELADFIREGPRQFLRFAAAGDNLADAQRGLIAVAVAHR
jgi:hypothetical protein